jgi:hypothetical protein
MPRSRAFDRVQYGKQFRLLIERKLPVAIVRVPVYPYMGNFERNGWCGVFLIVFATNNDKQYGVLSPVLFCVIIDDMLLALSNEGV